MSIYIDCSYNSLCISRFRQAINYMENDEASNQSKKRKERGNNSILGNFRSGFNTDD